VAEAMARRPTAAAAGHPEVADIRDLLTFRIAMLAAASDRVGQSWLLEEFRLRLSEWRALGLIAALEPVRFGALARALLIDKGQLSRQLKAMTERGLIAANPDARDQRALVLELTPHGRALHERVLSRALERNRLVAGQLTPAEADTLFRLLDKLQPFQEARAGQVVNDDANDRRTEPPAQ
jgi:DNA-binding MarR family transcriptional regulator